MNKYYRVKKDTPLWKEGAIICVPENEQGYKAIEDIWDAVPVVENEYLSARIIEHEDNSVFFERVYPNTLGGKLYQTKEQLIDKYKKAFA